MNPIYTHRKVRRELATSCWVSGMSHSSMGGSHVGEKMHNMQSTKQKHMGRISVAWYTGRGMGEVQGIVLQSWKSRHTHNGREWGRSIGST